MYVWFAVNMAAVKWFAELRSTGLYASGSRVVRIMKSKRFRCIITGRLNVFTTDSNHDLEVSFNILNSVFAPVVPSEKWLSDLTYIRAKMADVI